MLLLFALRLILYSRCVSIKKITFLKAIAGLLSNSRQLVFHVHAFLHWFLIVIFILIHDQLCMFTFLSAFHLH